MNLTTIIEDSRLNQRTHARLMRDINRHLGEQHKQQRLPRHFYRNRYTEVGGEYRFQGRTKKYRQRKQKKGIDPLRPNYFSGQLRDNVLNTAVVRATQNKWTVRARVFGFTVPRWQKRELEIIGLSEVEEDVKARATLYAAKAKSPEYKVPRRTVIRARGAGGSFLSNKGT